MRCVRIGLEFVFIRCEFGFTQMLFVESKLETEKQIQSSRYGTTILIESTRQKKYVSLAIYDNHVSYINIGVPFVLFEQHLTEHAAALCSALFFTASNVKAEKNLFIHLICKRITIIYSVVHTAKMFFLCIFMHVMHASCAIHFLRSLFHFSSLPVYDLIAMCEYFCIFDQRRGEARPNLEDSVKHRHLVTPFYKSTQTMLRFQLFAFS